MGMFGLQSSGGAAAWVVAPTTHPSRRTSTTTPTTVVKNVTAQLLEAPKRSSAFYQHIPAGFIGHKPISEGLGPSHYQLHVAAPLALVDVKKSARDPSPCVRKCVAYALRKLCYLLPEENTMLEEVLSDNSSSPASLMLHRKKSSPALGPHLPCFPQSPGASISSLRCRLPENRRRRGSPSRPNGGSRA
ncbi:hypothetical protein ACQ4PT_057024 [Festuca glaucescens]